MTFNFRNWPLPHEDVRRPTRVRLIARWRRDTDGKLVCRWESWPA